MKHSWSHISTEEVSPSSAHCFGSWPIEHFMRTFLRDYITCLLGWHADSKWLKSLLYMTHTSSCRVNTCSPLCRLLSGEEVGQGSPDESHTRSFKALRTSASRSKYQQQEYNLNTTQGLTTNQRIRACAQIHAHKDMQECFWVVKWNCKYAGLVELLNLE